MLLSICLILNQDNIVNQEKNLFYEEIFTTLEIQRQDMKPKPTFSLSS